MRAIKPRRRLKPVFWMVLLLFIALIWAGFWAASCLNLLPKRSYTAADFGIETAISPNDADGDGIDDYKDMMLGARAFVETKPKYDGSYFAGGYPPEGIGVCTDVIWQGFLAAGYTLKDLVDLDIAANREAYPEIDTPDPNIDFRRVKNLRIFFDRNAESLTLDPDEIGEWQPGDIVVYPKHIAIVSDKRNKKGQPYIIHHGGQPVLEEDALTRMKIVGHYRWNPVK